MKNLKRLLLMPLMVLAILFTNDNAWGQNAIVGTGFSSGWGGSCNSTGSGGFKYLSAANGNTYMLTTVANGTGNQYWRFGIDWSGTTNQWTNTSGSDVTVSPNTKYSLTRSCTTSGSLLYNVANTTDNYIFKTLDAGTNPTGTWVFFRVQGAVRSISSLTQPSSTIVPGGTATISVTLDGALATGQAAWIRYSTDNFTSSTCAKMTLVSGSTYSATIPAGTNTSGATVRYYAFTSGDGSSIAHADVDLYTINLFNNGGSNYSYTVASQFYSKSTGNLETTSNWGTATDGNGTAPVDFAQNGVTYNIRNNATPTIGASWTVSGTSSKIIVGNGTNACNFTVPSTFIVTSPTTDVSSNGTITRTTSGANSWGTLTFASGATYVHNVSGGTLPSATWNSNSTLQIDANLAADQFTQSFGNVTVNNTAAFFISTTSGIYTGSIQGNFIHNSSGAISLKNTTYNATFTIGGNLSITGGGTFRIMEGVGTAISRNQKVIVNGNFSLSSGTLNLSNETSSTISTSSVFALLEVKGNFTHTAGTISETATDVDVVTRITLTGTTGTQTLESTGQTGLVDFNVAASNAQCVISASKTFVLSSTATMTIANGTSAPDLLVDGTFSNFNAASPTVTGTITFSSTGTYEHNVASGTVPTATWNATSTCIVKAQTGTNPSGLGQNFGNFTWDCSTQTGTINLSGALGLTTGTVSSIQGNLTVLNSGAAFPSTTLRYLRLYGSSTGAVFKIGGDLILSSNSGGLSFGNTSAAQGALIIGGNLNMTAGAFESESSTSMNMIFTGTGKTYTQSGGTLVTVTKLNYVVANGASLTQGNDIGVSTLRSFILNGTLNTGASTVINGAGTFANQPALSLSRTGNTTINTNAIASLSSTTSVQVGMSITGANIPAGTIITAISGTTIYISNVASSTASGVSLTISTTASTLGVASTAGIVTGTPATTGNIRTTTATYDTGANYIYNNSTPAAQVTGSALTSANNLEISNTSGVTLSASTAVAGTLTLTNGSLTLAANDLTLGASATVSGAGSTRYVITNSTGQLKRSSLTTAFTFPVGNSAYNPITLTNTGTSDTYGIIAKDGTVPNALDATKAVNRYWAVTEGVAGSGNLAVTAQFNTADGAGAGYATTTNPQFIGLYPNATPWTQVSSGAAASGSGPYTVSASGFTNSLPTSGSTYYFAVGTSGAFVVPAPTITASGGVVASSPGSSTSGYVGNTITINGTGLGSVTVVKIGGSGGTTVSILSQTATTLTFAAINSSGAIYVENPGGNATSTESYTNLGYITTQTGGWSTAATWLGGAVPPSATTTDVTIAHNVTSTAGTTNVGKLTVNASTTLTITASTTVNINTASTNSGTITNNGTLSTAATYTNSGTMTMNGTFQLNSGGWATGSNFVYGASGTLNFNTTTAYIVNNTDVFWPTSNGPFNVSVLQGGLTLNSANRTVAGTFATAAGVTQTSSTLTISGTNQLNSGGFFNSAPTYSGSATLIYNNTGIYGINNEWTGNATSAGSGVPFNVTIQNSTTLTFPSSNRGIGGNFNVASGGATLNATSGDLYVAGNFTNDGTFTHNTRAVFLNGTTQTISGSALNTSGTTNCFDYLFIQNNSQVTLGAAVTIRTNLTFTSGDIILSSFDLTLSSGATITGASSTNYVITNSTGQLKRTVTTSSVSFPVGNSAYNPITLTNAGTSDTYGIRVADGAPANAANALVTVQRSWYITEAVTGGSDLTPVIAQYNSGEVGANYNAGTTPYMGLYNGSSWTQVATTLGGSITATSTGTNQFPATIPAGSYIAIGKDQGLTATPPSITSFSATSGYSGSSIVITGTNLTGATAVSFGGTAAASFTVDSPTQITAVVGSGGTSGSVSVTTPSGTTSSTGFTYLGFITTSGATNWNTGASWLGGAVPTANSAVTIAHNLSIAAAFTNSPIASITVNTGITATASATVAIGTVTNAITTSGTGVFTFSGAGGSIIAGSVVNGGTLSWSAAATLNISAGGTLTNNGTFTRGTGTVNFVGSAGTINGSNAITFNNLTINSGELTLTTVPTIDGTLQLNGGSVSAAPIYTSNSTLYYNLSYNRFSEWNATGVGTIGTTPGYPNNVKINTGTFDVVNGSNTARAMNGTLTVNTGATFNVNALNAAITIGGGITTNGTGSFNMGTTNAAVTVAGSVTNGGSLTLSSTLGGDIYVAGGFTNNGTFTHNTRAVFLNGTAQTISGSALNTSGTTNCFDYLFIQNNSQVTLGAAVTIRSNLNFNSGDIILSTFDLTLASGATITGASSANYVITNNTGMLVRTLATSTAVTFPIGNSAYNPITISQSGASDVYSLRMIDGSISGLSPNDVTRTINRRWSFSRTNSANVNIAVSSISYNTGEENNATNFNGGTQPYFGLYNGSSWVHATASQSSQTFTSSNSVASSTATSFSVAMGKDLAFLPAAPTVTSLNVGSGYSGSTIVITGTSFTGATAVSFGGTAAASFTVDSPTQITAVVGTGGASGDVSVTTPSGTGSLTAGFTYLGFITTSGATNWNTAGSWLGGAVPTANSAVTIAHNLSIAAAFTNTPIASVTVNTGITATASATVSIGTVTNAITTVGTGTFSFTGASGSITAGSFVNGGTLSWSAATTLNISASGTLTNNGTFTRGTGTVVFANAGTVNGSSAITFNNLTLTTGALSLATTPTIAGIFALNGGNISTNAPIYTNTSTLQYGLTYSRFLEWSASGIGTIGTTQGYPNNVTISSGTFTVVNSDAGTARAMAGNLQVNTGCTFTTGALNAVLTIGGSLTTTGTGNFNMSSSNAAVTVVGSVSNAGTLVLSSTIGGDLNVAGNWTNTGTFTHNSRAVTFNGTAAQTINSATTFAFLTIANTSANVTASANITIAASGVLTINSSARLDIAATTLTLTGATSSISGFLRSAGTITGASASTLTFNSGGTYEHNYTTTVGTIPTATWSSGSTCSIIGYTTFSGSANAMYNQTFSNLTWNCPNQSSNCNIQLNNITPPVINGNFSILGTGTGLLRLSSSTTYSLSVGGDLIVNSILGNANLDLTSNGTATLNIAGNITITQPSNTAIIQKSGSGTATINFNKASGIQTFSNSGTISGTISWNVGTGTSTNTVQLASNVNLGTGTGTFTVLGNATFDAGTFVLSGTAASTFNSGANIITANTGGVNGSVTLSGIRTYNPATNYTFNNSTPSAQVTGAAVTAANNITINNSAGVSLSAGTIVSGALTLTSGKLAIGSNTLTLNGTVASMSASNSLTGSSTSNLTIGGTGALGTLFFDQTTSGTTNTLQNVTINRTSTGSATLGNALNVGGTLTLTNGDIITTSTNTLTLGSAATISGGSSSSYIEGPLDRTLTNSSNFVYPIGGNSTNYRPISLNTVSVTGNPVVRVTVSETGATTADGTTLTSFLNPRNWQIEQISGTFTSATLVITESGMTNGTHEIGKSNNNQAGTYVSCGEPQTVSSGAVTSPSAQGVGFYAIGVKGCSNPTSGGTIAASQTICSGGDPAAFTSSAAASGNVGTLEYKWQYSSSSDFSSDVNDIGSSNSTIYDASSGLTATRYYRRLARVSCKSDWTGAAVSNILTLTVNSVFASGEISSTGQTICSGGTPSEIGSTTAASGGDGSITYSWRSSTDSYSTAITGATSATYAPPSGLTTTTSYRRYAKDGTCNITPTVSTGTWTVTVNSIPSAPTASAQNFCSASSPTIASLQTTSGTSIKWYDAETDGNLLSSGTSLTTGTYYASQTVSSCESSRTSVAVTINSNGTWIGDSNDDWNDANNWCGGIPNSNTVVVSIPSGVTVNLDFSANVLDLTIASGSTLNMGANTISIAAGGSFTNSGTFNAETGTISFSGNGSIGGSATTFNNLTVNGALSINTSPTVNGNVTINAGGSVTSNPIIYGNAATLVYNTGGSISSTNNEWPTSNAPRNVTVQNNSQVTLNAAKEIAGTLNLTSGIINSTSTNLLTIGSNTTTLGSVNWTAGTIVGPIKRWFSSSANSTKESGIFPVGTATRNRYAQVNFTSGSSGGYIIAQFHEGKPTVSGATDPYNLPLTYNTNQYIQNADETGYWDITPYDASGVAYQALDNVQYDLKLRINNDQIGSNPVTANPPGMRIIRAKGSNSGHSPFALLSPTASFEPYPGSTTGTDFLVSVSAVQGFSWFNIGGDNETPLPVELLSFNGNCENEQIQLIWKTASEYNSAYFDIEKSTDGEIWRKIDHQQSVGNSTELVNYFFEDVNKNEENNYYRLIQVDENGAQKVYDPILVNCSENTSFIKTYPNPSDNNFQLVVNNESLVGKALISIIDTQGATIGTMNVEIQSGVNAFLINEKLKSGLYFIQISNGNTSTNIVKHSVR